MAVDLPVDLASVLSQFGLPAGAIALAYGLVKGADALEQDASEDALAYILMLLKKGPLTSFGELGTAIVPLTFSKIFGSSAISIKFISRSILSSIIFWIILILIKHPIWSQIWADKSHGFIFAPLMLFVDWISLAKANYILRFMKDKKNMIWTIVFVGTDLSLTYLLPIIFIPIIFAVSYFLGQITYGDIHNFSLYNDILHRTVTLRPIINYLERPQIAVLNAVFWPSTLLTSVWVSLFLLSSIIVSLLIPLEQLRRFTLWGFKDIDKHPLKAIGKVAASLIVVGAIVLKVVQLGWEMV